MQTDPRFTNQRTWLNSDYLLGQLSLDAAGMQQRIGDGFYGGVTWRATATTRRNTVR